MKKLKEIEKEIKEKLDKAIKVLDNMEIESAPSGEHYEYNYLYEIQYAIVNAIEEVYDLFSKK